MSKDCLIVQPNRSLILEKPLAEDYPDIAAKLSAFAELTSDEEAIAIYKITDASIWNARRNNLSIEDIVGTLKRHSRTGLPGNLLEELRDWSGKIDRLTLQRKQGKLLLRSEDPMLLVEIQHHRQLRTFIEQQIDENTLELKPEKHRSLISTFDRHKYPILDIADGEYHSASRPLRRRRRRKRPTRRPSAPPPKAAPKIAPGPDKTPRVLNIPGRCRAVTRAGRQCKNRPLQGTDFCRVHSKPEIDPNEIWTYLPSLLLESGIVTMKQIAFVRLGILAAVGFLTWAFYHTLMWIGNGWLNLSLASWYTAAAAFLVACWILGRLPPGIGFGGCVGIFLYSLKSILSDFFNKEGIVLNLCFTGFPVVLPIYILYRYSLSAWWGVLLFPLGLLVGLLFYRKIESNG